MGQTSGDDGKAVCYLCLDGGDDGAGQPLRRDCACRGTDAGYVHLSCLTSYAETKSKQARDMNEFVNPWRECPGCHQYYQNELAIDIATKFVSFVRKQYPHNTQKQVEALFVKLRSLNSMLEMLQSVQKRELGVTANVMLSLIDRMRVVAPLTWRHSWFESYAYNTHGLFAIDEETEESARRAVVHFEKYLEVSKAIDDADGIVNAKRNIALAKSKHEDGNNNEEVLKASQEMYELRLAQFGEGHEDTILAGKDYAVDLQNANREDEARELLTKLLVTSKQVLGPEHNITKEIESELEEVIEVANED
jgi:hypothetical protein